MDVDIDIEKDNSFLLISEERTDFSRKKESEEKYFTIADGVFFSLFFGFIIPLFKL